MPVYEIKFQDGRRMIVRERTFSRAKVLAAYNRLLEGAGTDRELSVYGCAERPELDKEDSI